MSNAPEHGGPYAKLSNIELRRAIYDTRHTLVRTVQTIIEQMDELLDRTPRPPHSEILPEGLVRRICERCMAIYVAPAEGLGGTDWIEPVPLLCPDCRELK